MAAEEYDVLRLVEPRQINRFGPIWEEGPQRSMLMQIRFYRDPETGQPHIYNHGVTEEEVSQILARPGEDLLAAEGARMALGRTAAGRYLRVIYVPDPEPESVFVVTAYDLRGKPLRAYRSRQRRRPR